MNQLPFCYMRGSVISSKEATLSIASQSVQYGMTCFGGLRGHLKNGVIRILRLKDHHKRLLNGAKILGWDVDVSFEKFEGIIRELIEKNQPDSDFYIRPFFYTDDDRVAPNFLDKQFDLGMYLVPLGHYYDPEKGLKLMISSWRKFSDASISVKAKAGGCYLNSALATTDAKKAGYDDALLLDHQGYVAEASVANILLSYQGKWYAPPKGSGSLDGITMRTMLELLQDEGIEVHHQLIDRSMVYSADEFLLSGTAAQVLHASSVDGRLIGDGQPGPTFQLMRERFKEIIYGDLGKEKGWISIFECKERSTS